MIADTGRIGRYELGHFFITGGYKFKLNGEWTLQPSAFIKSSDIFFKYLQLDLTTRILYKDDFWAGMSWRSKDAFIMMAGLKYGSFYFGYAVDIAMSNIRRYSHGTHEITMGYKFGNSPRKYRWINAF
jgi:type IX secretion system PorP/SprF family membrane protein